MLSAIDATSLARFRDQFAGEVVLPGDPDYDRFRVVWNAIADRRPAIIARCAGPDDVVAAVRFAREQNLLIAVRGGGHSVGGLSTCDGGVVIDLSLMRAVTVDPERRVAIAQGGALLSQLDEQAQEFGLVCPVGVVGHTGVAGLTLGGGMGRLQRKHGLTIDNLLGVDIITADGRRLHASSDENADLFWGIRGAGPNFGVVTSLELQLHQLGSTVTQGFVLHPIERLPSVGALCREFVATAPEEVFVSIGFGVATEGAPFPAEMAGRPFVTIGATHSGSPANADETLRSVRGMSPVLDTFAPKTYLSLQSTNDEAMAWGKRFYMKSAFIDELTDEALATCADQVAKAPGGSEVGLWRMGGAIDRVLDDAMAFTGRQAGYWLGVETLWEDPAQDEDHIAWGRAAMAALKPFTRPGNYVNDVVESSLDVVRAIYGEAKYQRLVGLKRVYDPDNMFRLNQNIRP
jgi:FAD/FMN-containing dehydrogenase